MTIEELIAFEKEIADLFMSRQIHSPIHLSGGNEQQLIDIFRLHIRKEDWICCSWRSHYHCLLKGVPKEELKKAILEGKSISLCFPKYRIISSAIVGGMAPIAVGLAMGIKRNGSERKIVAFIGDMAAESGIVYESMKYAINHKLPLLWVVEDNGLSVQTDTLLAWGASTLLADPTIIRYKYNNTFPHVGCGQWVTF